MSYNSVGQMLNQKSGCRILLAFAGDFFPKFLPGCLDVLYVVFFSNPMKIARGLFRDGTMREIFTPRA